MPREEAESLLGKIRAERPDSLCAQRDGQYVEKRHSTEALLRREFAARGGIMEIESPHYMVHGKGWEDRNRKPALHGGRVQPVAVLLV